MRDRLIHRYDMVDACAVWQTVRAGVPTLLDILEPLVPSEEP